ncbi:unnamed protein product [Phyllotreta striolata]|uniref:Uncharacterized protein n=1 Tax=Phyllotreta striolata TaxID=444603 RepID=A0A9N9TQ66_PHYSR|nr:unnamed protein product [Phyllotreta striolata]
MSNRTTTDDLEIVKETLKALKEDILSKFDEVLESSRKQMEEVVDIVKKTVDETIKKQGTNSECLIKDIFTEASIQVKQVQMDTEQTLTTVWATSSAIIQSVSKTAISATENLKEEDVIAFVESIVAFFESVLNELIEHLSVMTIMCLNELDDINKTYMQKIKKE